MILSSNTIPLSSRYGDKKAIELLADAGFDGVDYSASELVGFDSIFSCDHIAYANELRNHAEKKGIKFTQAHAPMPYASTLEEYISIRKSQTIKAMEASAILGAELIVVHPLQYGRYKDNRYMFYDMNMKYYRELLPYAEKFGIKIACENIFQTIDNVIVDAIGSSAEEFNKYIDDIASPYFTACLDVGHTFVTGRAPENIIREMGSRITALHIHDNDGRTDLHKLPCTVMMNWDEICKALAEVGYNGNFNYEADGFIDSYDIDFLPTALKFMHDTGRYLISKIESYKTSK